MKKLFHVTASLEIDMVVLADSEDEARAIGEKGWYQEMSDAGLTPEGFHAQEVNSKSDLAWMGEENLEYCSPHGGDGRATINACLAERGLE